MEITARFDARTRLRWRSWLEEHHGTEKEIWLLLRREAPDHLTYLDAVEEAICFGWIDGIAKRDADATAQRFTPRRTKSHWTELNKERARRLIQAAKMTDAGRRTLPDLSDQSVHVAADVRARLVAEPGAWEHFQAFPALYQRVRLGYVEEQRNRDMGAFEKRLAHLVLKSAKNAMFGNWDDSGLPRTEDI